MARKLRVEYAGACYHVINRDFGFAIGESAVRPKVRMKKFRTGTGAMSGRSTNAKMQAPLSSSEAVMRKTRSVMPWDR